MSAPLPGWGSEVFGVRGQPGPAEASAVLRSWGNRFGVLLAGPGFDTITLPVPHPPRDHGQALRIAAEIAALCLDAPWQRDVEMWVALGHKLVNRPVLWLD